MLRSSSSWPKSHGTPGSISSPHREHLARPAATRGANSALILRWAAPYRALWRTFRTIRRRRSESPSDRNVHPESGGISERVGHNAPCGPKKRWSVFSRQSCRPVASRNLCRFGRPGILVRGYRRSLSLGRVAGSRSSALRSLRPGRPHAGGAARLARGRGRARRRVQLPPGVDAPTDTAETAI
jgi:hypothetical protein